MFEKIYKIQNSRTYKRLRTDYLIKYQTAGSSQEPFVANLKDISAGGLRFWSDHYVSEGVLLKVSIWVPVIDQILEGLVRIVRVRQAKGRLLYYLAARFVEIAPGIQAALNRFIENLAENPAAKGLIEDETIVKRTAVKK